MEIVKPGLFGNFGPATQTKLVGLELSDCSELTLPIEDIRLGIVVKAVNAIKRQASSKWVRRVQKIVVKFFIFCSRGIIT